MRGYALAYFGGALLADRLDININTNDSGGGSIRSNSNTPSSANIPDNSRELKAILNALEKDRSEALLKEVNTTLRSMIVAQHRSGNTQSSGESVDNIIKGLSQDINKLISEINRNYSKLKPSGQLPSEGNKAIEKIFNEFYSRVEKSILSHSKSSDIKINFSNLKTEFDKIAGKVKSDDFSKEIRQIAASAKSSYDSISRLVKSIEGAAKSGEKLDLSELKGIFSDFKTIFNNFKSLDSSVKELKTSVSSMSSESKALGSNLKVVSDDMKKAASEKISSVKKLTTKEVRNSPKEATGAVVTLLKNLGAPKDSDLGKLIKVLDSTKGNIDKFSKNMDNLSDVISSGMKAKTFSIEGAEKVIKSIEDLSTSVLEIPKNINAADLPKSWQNFFGKFVAQADKIRDIVAKVKFEVDESGLSKVLNEKRQLVIPATVAIDEKGFKTDLTNIVPKGGIEVPAVINLDDSGFSADAKAMLDRTQTMIKNKSIALNIKPPDLKDFELAVKSKDVVKAQEVLDGVLDKLSEIATSKASIKIGVDTSEINAGIDKTRKGVEDLNKAARGFALPNARSGADIDKAKLGKDRNWISPSNIGAYPPISKKESRAQEIVDISHKNISSLSKSLLKLQTQIVEDLEKEFEKSKSGWKVIRPKGSQPHEAFSKAPDKSQWEMQISRAEYAKPAYIKQLLTHNATPDAQASQIGKWLREANESQIKGVKGIDSQELKTLLDIKKSDKGGSVISQKTIEAIKSNFGTSSKLESLFEKTAAEAAAEKRVVSEKLVRNVALPAAYKTETGGAAFQTIHGSTRSISKFAKYETGFEVLYNKIKEISTISGNEDPYKGVKNAIQNSADEFVKRIQNAPVREKSSEQKEKAKGLSYDMLETLIDSFTKLKQPTEGREFIKMAYSKAAERKGFELQEQGLVKSVDEFVDRIDSVSSDFEKLPPQEKTFKTFTANMDKAGLSALDVVKDFGRIEQLNVYDIMGKILKGKPSQNLGKNPSYDKSIREFEQAIRELEDLMPLVDPNKPRREYHQENVVNLLTRTSPIYASGGTDESGKKIYGAPKLSPDEQKSLIKDLNLEFNEMFKRTSQIIEKHKTQPLVSPERRRELPEGLGRMSSLGIPESQAGNVIEYRSGRNEEDVKFLKDLKATGIKLYAGDLTQQAPFKQFQQAGRNISNVTNAMIDIREGSKGAEFPKLRSDFERALKESGRYGEKGYGYNVTAELRNTAANFEDQIVVGGKLAQALTSSAKILVKPSSRGRFGEKSEFETNLGTGVTDIKEGDVGKVQSEYMKILGVSEKYKGRADEALIDAVKKTSATVRGESVEVQTARLSETFLNYFGRKFTTRFGSKGVSVAPRGEDSEKLINILSENVGKSIKVQPENVSGLGSAITPKTMGELSSGLFEGKEFEGLRNRLVESGNRFVIDLFHKEGPDAIVIEEEAKKTQALYLEFSQAWQKVFSSPVPLPGQEGIAAIKSKYKEVKKVKDEDLFNVKPIDVRISSYGAAKRGLQTEFLESIMSNMAGTGAGGFTTLKDEFSKSAYENLLGPKGKSGSLKAYSESLGYQGAASGKSVDEIAEILFKKFGGKGTAKNPEEKSREKAELANRAAQIEASSSFYSKIVDETGKMRQGLVGEKFLNIIEEPHKNPEWQTGQINRGEKGARLNIPAYSAYASVFGEQSAFMGELKSSLDTSAGKHWEYLKALQSLQDKDSDIYDNLTRDLKTVKIKDIRSFDLSTGIPGAPEDVERSFKNTIYDIEKFAGAFQLELPTGKRTQEGTPETENLYIPGAAARGTYPDPIVAGEYGMDQVARRMGHVVSMGKNLSDILENPEQVIDKDAVADKLNNIIGGLIKRAWELANSKERNPEVESEMETILKQLGGALPDVGQPDERIIKTKLSPKDFTMEQYQKQMQKVALEGKDKMAAMAAVISTAGDFLIGKGDQQALPWEQKPLTTVKAAKEGGKIGDLSKRLGVDVIQEETNKRIANLQKAKVEYYNSLAESATGKSGSINELLFSRKIPSVIAKTITAVVDKKDDIEQFGSTLNALEQKYGDSFTDQTKALVEVKDRHSEAIDKYKKIGVPVLKQTEVGIPEEMASKIPIEYMKKYRISKTAGAFPELKPEKVSSNLFDLLKYTEKLSTASKQNSPEQQEEIGKYIKEELSPYVESIRFPFTGTSSIAPFKPRLMGEEEFKDDTGRNLGRNVLAAPGIPEGLEGLSPIIEALQKKIETLISSRETLHTTGGAPEEIEKLTNYINELSAAISDVIPKYTAQAQKLDFDGDQIEIHSAKTAAARQEIGKHFERFHFMEPNKAPLTTDVFRSKFLSEAADLSKVGATGDYVMGESQGAFEKKFPSSKGFEFMKTPFKTEGMEYVAPDKALSVLASSKQFGTADVIVKELLKLQDRDTETVDKIGNDIANIKTDKESSEYTKEIMELIQTNHSKFYNSLVAGLRKKLGEEKERDAVEANLFKIHTGMETEGLYRVHRTAENVVGFSGGEVGERTGKSSEYFQKRFPADLKSLGGRPEEEFHTMMNEVVRFGIQKGMDVKHAGERPVAGDMVKALTHGVDGAAKLWERVNDENDKTFGDLRDFSNANKTALKTRLGALSTPELMDEAQKIASARDIGTGQLSEMDRSKLMDFIIKEVGFEGFLKELSQIIQNEAVEGLISQAEQWTSAKKQKPGRNLKPVEGDITTWAKNQIQAQAKSEQGIDISSNISAGQMPLYNLRTSMAGTYQEKTKFEDKFGEIPVSQKDISALSMKERGEYEDKYRKAKATSSNIQREMSLFSQGKQGGAYSDMIRGAVDTLHEQQTEINDKVSSLVKEGYNPELAKDMDTFERLISQKHGSISSFAKGVIDKQSGMNSEVERLSDLSGVPMMSDVEKRSIKMETSSRFGETKRKELATSGKSPEEVESEVANFIDRMGDKAVALKQLDRVTDALLSRKNEGFILQDLMPSSKSDLSQYKSFTEEQRQRQRQQKETIMASSEAERTGGPQLWRERSDDSTTIPPSGSGFTGASGFSMGPGGIVPVHIVSANPDVTINVRGLAGAGLLPSTPSSQSSDFYAMDEVIKSSIESNKRLDELMKKFESKKGEELSYEKFISPSRLSGGGDVFSKSGFSEENRKKEQIDKLVGQMTKGGEDLTESGRANTYLGTAIHAKIENMLKQFDDISVEKYGEISSEVEPLIDGIIGGTADIIEYENSKKEKVKKIADIKTVSPEKFKDLQKATEKSNDLKDVIGNVDDDMKRKLNEYFGQLNTYLRIFDEGATAELRFYDKEKGGEDINAYVPVSFKFDPERFKSDMEQVAAAREKIKLSGQPFAKVRRATQAEGSAEQPSYEEIEEAVKLAKEEYARIKSNRSRTTGYGFSRREEMEAPRRSAKDMASDLRDRDYAEAAAMKSRASNYTEEDILGMGTPPEIAVGGKFTDTLKNLRTLHSQSELFQKREGISKDLISGLNRNAQKPITEALSSVESKGPDWESFIQTTNTLKDLKDDSGKSLLGQNEFIKVWKLYRMEVSNYLLKRAEEAIASVEELRAQGENDKATQKYGDFQNRVTAAQEFIKRGIGKKTDVFTKDKRFVYPGLAQAAGVYMSPEDIMKKAGQPIGDDDKLIETFKGITKNISEELKMAPADIAKGLFTDLSDMNTEMVTLMANTEKFKRMGQDNPDIGNFEKLASRATRLRAALQGVLKDNKEMTAEQQKSVETLVKYLKVMENTYSGLSSKRDKSGYGEMNLIPVPKFATPEIQKGLHSKNIQEVREYFRRPEEEKGPAVGESFNYTEKIVGNSGEVIKNIIHHFKKYGESLEESGQKTGQFSETQKDLVAKMDETSSSMGNAIRRVVMWGAASRLVYGGISELKSSLSELSNIQMSIAELRMVLNPLETDFGRLTKSATGFAKQYGVPVTDILKSMKVFAQQGLKQSEITDRTQTATLASNVTTLNAKDATEALTSAMVVFREEGSQSMRFLDAWTEVEAKHAVTSGDLANAIKKAAQAAKSAGFTFDELNGIVAAIGSVTRQTGNEVGTSLKFIFRQMTMGNAPKELAKLNIPVIQGSGEVRSGFDVLTDLSGAWKDLTEAQKLSVAQALGGTRQYNSVLVLMEQWDEVLRGVKNSTNSKGAAERFNIEVMKTYAKQLEQTKAAATELKMEFGKIVLPVFTTGLKGVQFLFETLSAIPMPIKAATAALAGFFTLGAQGIDIFDSLGEGVSKGLSAFDDLSGSFGKQMKVAKYEILGKRSEGLDTFNLKTITDRNIGKASDIGTKISPELTEQGKSLGDFQSSLGKMMFTFVKWGQSYNEMIGNMITKTGSLAEKVGETSQGVGTTFSMAADAEEQGGATGMAGVYGVYKGVRKIGEAKGLSKAAVSQTFKKYGIIKGLGKLAGPAVAMATEVAGAATYITGQAVDAVGEQLGSGGHKILKDFTTQNAGFVKSLAPMVLTIAALTPAIGAAADYFGKMTKSAKDFESSMSFTRQLNADNLKSTRDLIQGYDALNDKVKNMAKAADPNVKARRQDLGTYESPLKTMQSIQERSLELGNKIAASNVNMVVGYDALGNAVLKADSNYKSYLKSMERMDVKSGISTELEILSKHLEDLAEGSETEKVKQAFKELAEAFPVIGNLVSRNIKISPAKSLEMASEDLNKRLNLKQKYPLSEAANKDITRLQEVLSGAREAYGSAYKDMKKVYGSVLSSSSLKGLNRADIETLVNSPELKKAYEFQVKVDPKFKLVGGVTWQDIMGKELLSALNPNTAGVLDVVSEFTTANLESAGVKARSGKAASGDLVTFYKDIASEYNIAGKQAVIKLKGTDDWVVEYFNTRTLKIEERPLSEVEGMVENIFPLQKIQEDLSYRMDALNTFVAGASAGLSGISKKDFKKDFNLGERFFGEIPTTTLLQGNKGYSPRIGYGNVDAMKSYQKDMDEFYFKPMEELKVKTEQVEKLKLEGLDSGDISISKTFYEEVNRLLDVLKNNQVVLQFRAVFVDLMKEMSNSQRVLKEDIAIMKQRSQTDLVSGGLTKGMPLNLDNIDLGMREIKDITPRQSLLTKDKSFRQGAVELKALEITSQSNKDMIDKFERASVQIDEIMSVAKGFGATASPERMAELVEKVVPDQKEGPFYDLKKIDQGIEKNTASTVDKLDSILENMGDPAAVEKQLKDWTDTIAVGGATHSSVNTIEALERVAGIRSKAEGRGDQGSVVASNKALDVLTKQLIAQVGYKKGMEMVNNNFTLFSKKFKPEEFQQRAFGGVDSRLFADKLKEFGTADAPWYKFWKKSDISSSKSFKKFQEAQKEQVEETAFSSKNMARVAAVSAALSQIQQSGNKSIIKKLDDQISILDLDIENARKEGKVGKPLDSLVQKRSALQNKREEFQKDAEFYGSVKAISATGFAVTELSKSFGLTDSTIKGLGLSSAGLLAAFEMVSSIMGTEIPESAKKFKEELMNVAKKAASGDDLGAVISASGLKSAGDQMIKDFNKRTKDIFPDKGKSIEEAAKTVDTTKLAQQVDASIKTKDTRMKEYESSGDDYKKYAQLMKKQVDESSKYLAESGEDASSSGYKDLKKRQEAEKAEFTRGLKRLDKESIISKYPSQGSSEEINKILGTSADDIGEKLVRGLEKADAPSKLKQLIVAYIATGFSDYASNKSAEKTALADTEKIMKNQSEALAELIRKYPDAAEAALSDLQKRAESSTSKLKDLGTIDKPLTQDTNKAKEEIKKQLNELQDTYIKEQKRILEEQAKIQNKLADKEARAKLARTIEDSSRVELERIDASKIDKRYSQFNVLNSGLSGYGGDVTLPISEKEMSVQQRSYAETKKSATGPVAPSLISTYNPLNYLFDPKSINKNLTTFSNPMNYGLSVFKGKGKEKDAGYIGATDSYSEGLRQLETMTTNLKTLKQLARSEQYTIGATKDKDARMKAKDRLVDINDQIERLTKSLDGFSEKLRNIAELRAVFDQFQSSVFQLKDSLKEVGIQESVERLTGFDTYKRKTDRMLGGGSQEAITPVSVEDTWMGMQVGRDLQHLKSNQYDVQEAKLRYSLRTAVGEDAQNIMRQLSFLPDQRERDMQTEEQKKQDDRFRRGMQPYEEMMIGLERAKQSQFIRPESYGNIDNLQKKIDSIVSRAPESMSKQDYLTELEANKGRVSTKDYEDEIKRVKALETPNVYRGVPVWEKEDLADTTSQVREILKQGIVNAPSPQGAEMEALLADPITKKIDETNSILTMIAAKEFGVELDPSVLDIIRNRSQKLVSRAEEGAEELGPILKERFKEALKTITPDWIESLLSIPDKIRDLGKFIRDAADEAFTVGESGVEPFKGKRFGGAIRGFNYGGVLKPGIVKGPGTETSDSVLANPSGIGFIVNAASKKDLEKKGLLDYVLGNTFSSGSSVSGNVAPIRVSKNELAIAKDMVKSRGVDFYNYVNKYGDVPFGLADGGQPEELTPKWAEKHPNLYGAYGALKETPKEFAGYLGEAVGEMTGINSVGRIMSGDTSLINYADAALSGVPVLGAASKLISGSSKLAMQAGESLIGQSSKIFNKLMSSEVGAVGSGVGELISKEASKKAKIKLMPQESGRRFLESATLRHPTLRSHYVNLTSNESVLEEMAKYVPEGLEEGIGKTMSGTEAIAFKFKAGERDLIAKYKTTDVYDRYLAKNGLSPVDPTNVPEMAKIYKQIDLENNGAKIYFSEALDTTKAPSKEELKLFKDNLSAQGYITNDVTSKNVGYDSSGKLKILDYNALTRPMELAAAFAEGGEVNWLDIATNWVKNNIFGIRDEEKFGDLVKKGSNARVQANEELDAFFGDTKKKGYAYGGLVEEDSKKWALSSMADFNTRQLAAARGNGLVDPANFEEPYKTYVKDSSMGISAQYDTNMLRGALKNRELEEDISLAYKAASAKTISDNLIYRSGASYIPSDNTLTPDINRNIVKIKDYGIAGHHGYSPIKDLREGVEDFNKVPGIRGTTSLSSMGLAAPQSEKLPEADYHNRIKENMDLGAAIKKAFSRSDLDVQSGKYKSPLVNDKERQTVLNSLEAMKTMYDPSKKAPLDEDIQAMSVIATEGVSLKNINLMYKEVLMRARNRELKSAFGMAGKGDFDLQSAMLTSPNIVSKMMDAAKQSETGQLSESQVKMYNKLLESSAKEYKDRGLGMGIMDPRNMPKLYNEAMGSIDPNMMTETQKNYMSAYEESKKVMAKATLSNKEKASYGLDYAILPTTTTSSPYGNYTDEEKLALYKKIIASGLLNMGSNIDIDKLTEKFSSSNYGSAPAKHNGGLIPQTGKYFLQGGEVVMARGLAYGGAVSNAFADGGPTGSIDIKSLSSAPQFDFSGMESKFSNMINELKDIKLKVEDKKLEVEDKKLEVVQPEWKIEVNKDAKIEVVQPDWKVEVDKDTKIEVVRPEWKIEVEKSEAKVQVEKPDWKVEIDKSEAKVQVEKPDWKVDVEIPSDPIRIDIGDVASRLSTSIIEALNTKVNVEVSGLDRSMGADKFDELSKTISEVNNKILNVNKVVDDKFKMIEDNLNNETSSSIEGRVITLITGATESMRKDMSDMRNDIGQNSANMRQISSIVETKLSNITYSLNDLQNKTNAGR